MPPRLRAIKSPTSLSSIPTCRELVCRAAPSRSFSITTKYETRQRRVMFQWLKSQGAKLSQPLKNQPNYLSAYDKLGNLAYSIRSAEAPEGSTPALSNRDLQPFPLNRHFISQPVTSEAMRENIWEAIMKDGKSVSAVSAQTQVDMRRVGAIVRLKEVEKEWMRQGKKLAKPYARAVMEMLPVWGNELLPNKKEGFESINDLQVHRATTEQIWYPTSESRAFTREDAAKAFDDTLLSADKRIPHPELVLQARDQKSGLNVQERREHAKQRELETLTKKLAADEKRRAKEAASVKVVGGARWDFKFKNITVESVGKDGRGPTATGWRYGNPHNDRKRGTIKIPTRV